jgi:hypothetical protein
MIDPFTAFAMAQGAVKGIKAAMQLGKDVTGLYREFGTFFKSADAVHIASAKMRMETIGKSDAEISNDALQVAMASKALRDSEKELKDLLYWSGNAPVWDQMLVERVRMMKARNAAEALVAKLKQKKKEDTAEAILNGMIFLGAFGIIIPVITITFQLIVKH